MTVKEPLAGTPGVDAVLVPAHVSSDDLDSFALNALKARNIAGLWLAASDEHDRAGLAIRPLFLYWLIGETRKHLNLPAKADELTVVDFYHFH